MKCTSTHISVMTTPSPPALTAPTCAICDENKVYHVGTACAKPMNPRGHEPIVCLQCFQSTIRNCNTRPVPCPMCRAPVILFRQYKTDSLRQSNATLHEDFTLRHVQPLSEGDNEPYINTRTVVPRHQPRHYQQHHQRAGNTLFGLFRQQVMQHEGINQNMANNFDRIQQELLNDSFITFASYQIYQRILTTMHCSSPPCNILLPELLQHANHLAPNGLCKSCYFPIGFHKRSIQNDQ